ncbi:transglycosylase domain-containing protein [Peribacillus asahii]|uniref:Penicillin-binding protein n=1 Tax=Peribacillus asahii TaxID=228899 RepID=A0A3T0KYS6_9BACI|nr:transglycosylase domain-containing protein [Peribacillus asahii]AZV45469.1 penicillin-binding protein [Peribacillus asahii]USK85035.1 penicillin-binding protein [Peribacillus asahii]
MEVIPLQRFKRAGKYVRAFLILATLGIILLFIMLLSLLIYAKILGPPPLAVPESTLYYSESGTVIGETNNGQKRYWVSIDSISPELVNATIAVEDRQFYTHKGFDVKRIGGAIIADLKARAKVQGASTITQQYARNLFLDHDKTWKRKWNEALYTIRLEMNYSKEEILEGYLNTIYYGHGAYGAEAASQYYFGKTAKELTLAEASILAGIPKGPSSYSPIVNLEKAKTRQNIVLHSMVQKNYISEAEQKQALQAPLSLKGEHTIVTNKMAPYFQDAVKQTLQKELGIDERTIELGGLRVYTTLDEKQQALAEEAFEKIITKSSNIQGALVAMKPKTGEVTALVGGRDYQQSPFNRATQAIRQPGSTIKPLLYYAALENGFTPSTTLMSEKTTFKFDEGQSSYSPSNYNHQYADSEITLAQAIALSDNIYAVKTHLFLGQKVLRDTAKRFGLTSKMEVVPSLALGTSGARIIEMVNAYSLFANGGKKVKPVFITKVENHQGDVLFQYKKENEQVLDPDQTFVMTQMLTGVFDETLNGYTKVTGSTISKQLTHVYAGKSGSTSTDSWMIGYTPQLVTGVWTGYDQAKKIENPAEKVYAKKIWATFMEASLKDKPVKYFKETSNVIGLHIDPKSGKIASERCSNSRLTYFVKGTEPEEYCPEHFKGDAPKEQQPAKKPWYKWILKPWG